MPFSFHSLAIKIKTLKLCLLLTIISQTLTGCTLFSAALNRDYIESVFKRQNAISSHIMLMSESELSNVDYDALLQAESEMQRECRLLNQAAQASIDQQNSNLSFKKQVTDSVEDCDDSLQKVEELLESFNIEE